MHACGHDIHMASWVGAATLLANSKDTWRGTLVLVGQPAEETVSGAAAMVEDGFLKRFPRPDYSIAIHDSALYPAGSVAIVPGYALANVDMVDVTIYGKEDTVQRRTFTHATGVPRVFISRCHPLEMTPRQTKTDNGQHVLSPSALVFEAGRGGFFGTNTCAVWNARLLECPAAGPGTASPPRARRSPSDARGLGRNTVTVRLDGQQVWFGDLGNEVFAARWTYWHSQVCSSSLPQDVFQPSV
jgi:hypothetical protein